MAEAFCQEYLAQPFPDGSAEFLMQHVPVKPPKGECFLSPDQVTAFLKKAFGEIKDQPLPVYVSTLLVELYSRKAAPSLSQAVLGSLDPTTFAGAAEYWQSIEPTALKQFCETFRWMCTEEE